MDQLEDSIVTRMPDLTETPLDRIGTDQYDAAAERGAPETGAKLSAAFFQSAV